MERPQLLGNRQKTQLVLWNHQENAAKAPFCLVDPQTQRRPHHCWLQTSLQAGAACSWTGQISYTYSAAGIYFPAAHGEDPTRAVIHTGDSAPEQQDVS